MPVPKKYTAPQWTDVKAKPEGIEATDSNSVVPRVYMAEADITRTSSTAYATFGSLSVVSGRRYAFRAMITLKSASAVSPTTGKIKVAAPATSSGNIFGLSVKDSAGAAPVAVDNVAFGSDIEAQQTPDGTDKVVVFLEGFIKAGADGSVTVSVGAVASTANTLTIEEGSWFQLAEAV